MNEMLDAHGYGGGQAGNAYAKAKKKWTNDIALLAKVAKIQPVGRAHFRFIWHERNRQRNPDNISAGKKMILDGLVTARVLVNDGWQQIAGWIDEFCVSRTPGVMVWIEPVHQAASMSVDELLVRPPGGNL